MAEVTNFITINKGNIVYLDQYVDHVENIFFMRIEWEIKDFFIPKDKIEDYFETLYAQKYEMKFRLYFSDVKPKMAIFVSKLSHCLFDMLARYTAGEWNVEIPLIISNHPDLQHVAERFGIPFYLFPITKENKMEQEKAEMELLEKHNINFIVLARYMQVIAEQMIEECMILANVCVAHHMHVNKIPSMYRVHENPDPKKVATICTVANSLRIPFDFYPDEVNASQIQKFLESIQDENSYEVLSMVALRSMQKARYDAHCLGHFGLALEEYCHFTSPIRRYSDLVVHRMLHAYCFNEQKRTPSNDEKKIEKQAFHISEKERDAIMMERMVNDYKKAQFMEKRIGQVFEGTIVGVMSFGFFVEMDNTVEGLVPVHTLSNDFYDYDEDTMTLKGQTHGKVFQMGMRVRVVCTDVQREKGQVTFSLLERRNHD